MPTGPSARVKPGSTIQAFNTSTPPPWLLQEFVVEPEGTVLVAGRRYFVGLVPLSE